MDTALGKGVTSPQMWHLNTSQGRNGLWILGDEGITEEGSKHKRLSGCRLWGRGFGESVRADRMGGHGYAAHACWIGRYGLGGAPTYSPHAGHSVGSGQQRSGWTVWCFWDFRGRAHHLLKSKWAGLMCVPDFRQKSSWDEGAAERTRAKWFPFKCKHFNDACFTHV